eukprot:09630.XXX_397291_397416_1 [CDS] Oithona nana genome sequencing.
MQLIFLLSLRARRASGWSLLTYGCSFFVVLRRLPVVLFYHN